MFRFRQLLLAAAWLAALPVSAEQEPNLINCVVYRTKRDSVPVYAGPEMSSRVITNLPRGELVCHIGEQCMSCAGGPYSIIDWRQQDRINHRAANLVKVPDRPASGADSGPEQQPANGQVPSSDPASEIVYVRSVDLLRNEAPRSAKRDVYSQAEEHLKNLGHGIVPEDIYGPFRPFIDVLHPPTRCRAGAVICNRVTELQASPTPSPR